MTSLIALCLGLITTLLAPLLLTRGSWAIRFPRLALAGWTGALVTSAATLLVAVGAWLLPVPMWQRPGCAGCGPAGAFLIGFGAAALLGALGALVAGQAERLLNADRAEGPAVALLASGSTDRHVTSEGITVSHVDGLPPLALSSRACGRQIVVSNALVRHLSPAELASVVEHERAHLAARHDWVLLLARLNVTCFPRLIGARAFAARVHLLIELVADDRAARVCGTEHTASALSTLASLTQEEGAALRAARLRSYAAAVGAVAA